ncbi:hypothetical protein [Geoglobus sp.]
MAERIYRLALIFSFVLAVTTTLLASAVVAEQNYGKYQGLMAPWHDAKICMPCHVNTLTGKELDRFLSCTPCHNKNLNLNDQNQLLSLHGVNFCIKCHVGSVYNSSNLGMKVHVPHYRLTCDRCHGDDGAISKPDTNSCIECHGSNPHSVHGRVLDDVCFYCHSEYMKEYLPNYTETELKSVGISTTPAPQETPAVEERQIRSIADLILWIVNLLF